MKLGVTYDFNYCMADKLEASYTVFGYLLQKEGAKETSSRVLIERVDENRVFDIKFWNRQLLFK